MATTLNSPNYASDWLKGESHAGEYFSRDTGVLASGQGVLVTGTVLAQLTANGKWVVAAATGSDGSQTASGILFNQSVDATSADQPVIVVSRHATISHQGLVWGSTINSAILRAVAAAQLALKGIIDRQGGLILLETILDIFNNAAFSAVSLTDNVNVVPNSYGRLNQLGIFTDEPIPTTSVAIQIENGVLNLLPTRARGAPPTFGTPEKRSLKSFMVPHIPHDDSVLATDVQNMLAWAAGLQAIQLETVIGYVNRKLINMRRKHAITLENLRMGAIKGVLTDADGTTLLNLFTEFGVTQNAVDFLFGTSTTNVGGVVRGISGYMEDNLMGDTMTSVHALCSPSFFNRLISHASVVNAYQFYTATPNPNRDDTRRGFPFQGVFFEEYRGYATYLNEDKTTTKSMFIPDGDARFFPLGTTETFATYWAPPDFMTSVNEAPDMSAQVFVAPLEPMKFGKGMDIHTESNPLPMVKRPALLVRGFSSN